MDLGTNFPGDSNIKTPTGTQTITLKAHSRVLSTGCPPCCLDMSICPQAGPVPGGWPDGGVPLQYRAPLLLPPPRRWHPHQSSPEERTELLVGRGRRRRRGRGPDRAVQGAHADPSLSGAAQRGLCSPPVDLQQVRLFCRVVVDARWSEVYRHS